MACEPDVALLMTASGSFDIFSLASGWCWQFSQKKQQFSVALPTP